MLPSFVSLPQIFTKKVKVFPKGVGKKVLGMNAFSGKLTVQLFSGAKVRVRNCALNIGASAISTNTQVTTTMGSMAFKS